MAHSLWSPPPEIVQLRRDEVHVWRARLDCSPEVLASLRALLSSDEQDRAARFRFRRDRDRFIAARGWLRSILARYTDHPPQALRFGEGPYGKPFLTSPPAAPTIQFNVSHSGNLALYAMTQDHAVGIDVERVRPERVDERVAERFMSPDELAYFRTLSAREQHAVFFHYWTRKEAFAKALGKGLQVPLTQLSLSLMPRQHLDFSDEQHAAQRWRIVALPIDEGYAAALAAEADDWIPCCWQWPLHGGDDEPERR